MVEIDIGSVLKKFDDTYDEQSREVKDYGIKFLDRHGNTPEVMVRKNVVSPQHKGSSVKRGKTETRLKETGTIMLYDIQAEHPITPKTCMIFAFRDFQSSKWLNVLH